MAAIQRSTLDVVLRMALGGRGRRFDSDRARAAASASEATVPDILADRRAVLFAMAALMGRAPADYPRDLEGCTFIPSLRRPVPVGNGATLLKRRPDIRRAERLLASATAGIGVAEADLYPRVSPGKTAGTATSINHALTPSSSGLSLSPLVSWSFPNRQAVCATIAEAHADADVAFAGFDGSVLRALQQTETALSGYARARDRLNALERAAGAAGKASGNAERLQRFGRTPFLDLPNAQASYANAQASLSTARANLVDRDIDLSLALGGGWGSVLHVAANPTHHVSHPVDTTCGG